MAAAHAAAVEWQLPQASAQAVVCRWKLWQRWLKAAQQQPVSASAFPHEQQKSALRRRTKFRPSPAIRPQPGPLSAAAAAAERQGWQPSP